MRSINRRDEVSIITIIDSKKDRLINNGYNNYPFQLEELLYEHELVKSCVVGGITDEMVGGKPKAFVVLKPGATAILEEIKH
ncbi:AMP-binding enzyme [Solibacillus sp. FSL H8-0538]|uniref:AMP-binding enzyme n=1 Tax=Solibacillus sp. FSL H8-0538 TaxID=2921400 RepID=UPI0030F92095